MDVNFDIRLNSLQREMLDKINDDDVKYLIVKCSRQIGKSIGCQILMLTYLFNPNNKFNMWLSPTFRQAKKIYREMVDVLPPRIIKSQNKSELTIELYNGNICQFFSGEAIETMRGFTLRGGLLIIDEAAFIKESEGTSWFTEVVLPTTKTTLNPKIVMVSTPAGKQGEFYRQYCLALKNTKGYALVERTIYDDENISEELIDEIISTTPEFIFRQEYLCEFLDSSLTVFNGFENCFTDFEFDFELPCYYGIDLSTCGDDNTVLTLINTKKQVFQQVYEIKDLDKKILFLANELNKIKKPIKGYCEINSLGLPIFNDLRKHVNNKISATISSIVTTHNNKTQMINKLCIDIANKDIFFNNKDKGLFAELSTFTYKITANRNIIYGALPGHHDDRVMSLALALLASGRPINPLKNNKLITANYEKVE